MKSLGVFQNPVRSDMESKVYTTPSTRQLWDLSPHSSNTAPLARSVLDTAHSLGLVKKILQWTTKSCYIWTNSAVHLWAYLPSFCSGQCDRVAKVMDSKSIGLCPQGFKSPRCRFPPLLYAIHERWCRKSFIRISGDLKKGLMI